jgi:hypothetical protein
MRFFSNAFTVVMLIALSIPSHAATRTWTGADPSGYWSASANWSPAGVPQNGDELVFPGGLPAENTVSTNDLTDSIFRLIRFDQPGGHTIRGNPITLTNGINNSGTNVIACDLTAIGAAIWGSGELTVTGNVRSGFLGSGPLYVYAVRLVITGQYTGGNLIVESGTVALYGDSPYAVSAEVKDFGEILVEGSQPNLNIRMTTFGHSLGTLGGGGLAGDVSGTGFISLDSTLSVKNLSVGGSLYIYLNGTNVGEYGRLVASGAVGLRSFVNLLPSAGFNPQEGQIYTIVEKTSPGPIGSSNLGPEGTVTYLNGMPFRISYVGGDGNDVTLTATTDVLSLVDTRVEGGNNNGIIDYNECNHLFIAVSNHSVTSLTGVVARLDSFTPGAVLSQGDSIYPNLPARSVGTNSLPFQLRATVGLYGIWNFQMLLTLTTQSGKRYSVPFTVVRDSPHINGGGDCASCLPTITGALNAESPRLPLRLESSLIGRSSICAAQRPCPRTTSLNGPNFRYNAHAFTNAGPDACVAVVLSVGCPGPVNFQLQASAYSSLADFPADLCANYLGDAGEAEGSGAIGFAFRVAAGAPFFLIVNEAYANQGCTNYTLELHGLPCPPPPLNIEGGSHSPYVRLSWSTGYPAFHLQRAAMDGTSPFIDVLTPPLLIERNYTITEPAVGNGRSFRLKSP